MACSPVPIQLSGQLGRMDHYCRALREAGGLPVPGYASAPDLTCAGLVLCGGGDLDPGLFDQARQAKPTPDERWPLPSREELARRLTPQQYAVTQEQGTEPPFRNPYWEEERPGIYVDVTTGRPLFLSAHKFPSSCGWPSFSRPLDAALVEERTDRSHGMVRTEVLAAHSHAHLGHVFADGPKELGGRRYCINSAALRFIPREEMEDAGYGDLLPLVEGRAGADPH